MRRWLVTVAAVLLLASAGAAQAAGTPLQANRAVAQRDARALLAELRLPPGSRRSAGEPPGAGGALLRVPRVTAINTVGVSDWWVAPTSPGAVLAYVQARRPRARGDYQLMTDPGSTLAFIWTIAGPHLLSQQLRVTVAPLSGGRTGVMAQAQSTWMVPRPVRERVPVGVRSITVTLRIGSGPFGTQRMHRTTSLVRKAWRVSALVRAFDGLPIVQPGVLFACPLMLSNGPWLSLSFRGAGGRQLARTSVSVHPGTDGGAGWNSCDPLRFWIGGRSQIPLTSRTFVSRIAALIGADVS